MLNSGNVMDYKYLTEEIGDGYIEVSVNIDENERFINGKIVNDF